MKKDIFESIIDVGSGFILAVLIQLLIFPLFGLHPTIFDSIGIALIFTVVSMTRDQRYGDGTLEREELELL